MIKLLLFDLGETLLHDGKPLPGAVAALEALAKLNTKEGKPVVLGLVSDFQPVDPPGGEAQVAARESECAKVLKAAELERFFQPIAERVTLSARAGAELPAKKVFELAAQRSQTGAGLSDCLFVSEQSSYLAKAREHGLTVVRFGPGPGIQPSFGEWKDAPKLITKLVRG